MRSCDGCKDFEPVGQEATVTAETPAVALAYSDFPHAFDPETLRTRDSRGYVVVLEKATREVKVVVETSSLRGVDPQRIYRALQPKLAKLTQDYPRPEYELTFGQGDLHSVQAYLCVSGWEKAATEHLPL